MDRDPLNRTSAPIMVRFFDLCFKQGVLDAYNFADNYGAQEFVAKHKAEWDFGVLGEPDDFDWQMWRFTLYRWGRKAVGFKKFSENYIYKITRKNLWWCFLQFCMRFYLMGIEEWLEYPNPIGIQVFKGEGKIHWTQQPRGLKKMTVNDFISYMHEFAYDYRRVPIEKQDVGAPTMDTFCQAVFDLTRKYETKRKIRE